MGVKFVREYENIISDLSEVLIGINDIYTFFEMPEESWKYTSKEKKKKYIETLSDDLFFGLGAEKEIELGLGKIIYNDKNDKLEVFNVCEKIGEINLI